MQIANNNVDSFNNNIKGKKENEDGLYTSFIYSIRSEVTRQIYLRCLKYYMKFLGINNLRELVEGKPQKIIEADIKAYLVYLRKQKKVSYNTKSLYLAAIRKFYYVNSDYQFKWNLITMYLGSDDDDTIQDDYYNNKHPIIKYDDDENEGEDDRPYTMDEIRKMFNAAQDIRVKIIISLLSSSGLRHGAVNILKLRDLEKIEKYNIYKVTR
jgi:integrase